MEIWGSVGWKEEERDSAAADFNALVFEIGRAHV